MKYLIFLLSFSFLSSISTEINAQTKEVHPISITLENGKTITGEITGVFDDKTDEFQSFSLSQNLLNGLGLDDKEFDNMMNSVLSSEDETCMERCNRLNPGDENKRERRRCKWRCVGQGIANFFKNIKVEIKVSPN